VAHAVTHPPLTSGYEISSGAGRSQEPSSPRCQSETLGASNEGFCKGALMMEEHLATIVAALSPARIQGPLLDHMASTQHRLHCRPAISLT
jgi:hypothetical protein